MLIEKENAFHLGVLKRAFNSKEIDEDIFEKADETNFILNMDNGRTLGFVGSGDVKYADFVSGGEPIKVMVRIMGVNNTLIQVPMLIFQNTARSYPIIGVPDTIPGVCYQSSSKGWMEILAWKK